MSDRFTIIQQGDGNTANQVNRSSGRLSDPVADHEAMVKFLKATAGSLAALELPTTAQAEAVRTLDAIEATHDAGPDDTSSRTRRRELAASLWRIVEGAAGSAIGAALLGLWHP